jgi:hypothetical protein
MDVDKIEGSAGAAGDAESVRQRLFAERRAIERHQDRAEHEVTYFLPALTQHRSEEKLVLLPISASPRRK